MVIAIDFDGTCVTHDYPEMGKDIGAIPVLKKLIEHGHVLMLWTMRSGDTLVDAVKWFEDNGIELWGINENPHQQETGWSSSNKQYANLFVDDSALGALVKYDLAFHHYSFIDWEKADEMFENTGLYATQREGEKGKD